LEEAVAKMSGRSARLFGLRDRGLIAPGRRADLVLFSPEITDRAGPRSPAEEAEGVRWLFVGGETAVRRGEVTGSRSGEVAG
jgi:N-acyl-D-amino-acid deacylase